MSARVIHAVPRDGLGLRALCGTLIDGVTATGHYPPIEATVTMPACPECVALTS